MTEPAQEDRRQAATGSGKEQRQPRGGPGSRWGRAARGDRRSRGGSAARGGAGSRERTGAAGASVRQREDGRPRRSASAEGVVELLGNGSAFLRVQPAGGLRRGRLHLRRAGPPLRARLRRSRHRPAAHAHGARSATPSLVRVETINGAPAGEVSEGARYDERPVAYPSERLALDGGDPTLKAIEWLTPFGRGSRVVIAGPARAGKTEILRRLLGALGRPRGAWRSRSCSRACARRRSQSGARARSRPRARSASRPPPTPRARRSNARSRPPSAPPRAAETRSC